MEPRAAAKVNSGGRNTCRTLRRVSVSQAADWIRKQRRGTRRGVPCIECRWPSGNTWSFVSSGKPHGWRKRPLDTASQAVKDAPSVPILSRRFLGLCYGVQTRSLASVCQKTPRQSPTSRRILILLLMGHYTYWCYSRLVSANSRPDPLRSAISALFDHRWEYPLGPAIGGSDQAVCFRLPQAARRCCSRAC